MYLVELFENGGLEVEALEADFGHAVLRARSWIEQYFEGAEYKLKKRIAKNGTPILSFESVHGALSVEIMADSEEDDGKYKIMLDTLFPDAK